MNGPNGSLYVDDGGKGGLPVVFVHACAGNTAHWDAQLRHLRGARRAIALDLRGHGRSQVPADGDFSVEGMAKDIATVVDGLGLDRFVLVGHSLGGAVCLAYAGQHPERVAGLFLLDPSSDARQIPPEQARGMMQALSTDTWRDTLESFWSPMLEASRPEVRERVLSDLRHTPREAVVGSLESMLHFDPVAALQRYRGPRLTAITGFNEGPDALQRLVPDLPARKVEGTGHWVQLDAPEQVNALLDVFLGDVATRRPA